MKNMFGFEFPMNGKDCAGMEYLAGVPASEIRLYWSASPWTAFRSLIGRRG